MTIDPNYWMAEYSQLSADWNELFRALAKLGLELQRQPDETWNWRWGTLKGAGQLSSHAAVIAAINEMLKRLPPEERPGLSV